MLMIRKGCPLLLSLFLPGCTHNQQSIVDTFTSALAGGQDVTVADRQIQALPYPTMYLRLNGGRRIFVVLGYIEQNQSKWLSQDGAMLVTRNGRLLKTVNLDVNLLEVADQQQDPLRDTRRLRDGARWRRDIIWREAGRDRSATLTSRFAPAGEETLTIAGRPLRCQRWRESVRAEPSGREWHNTFWVDAASGQVRQSRQMLGAGVYPVEFTLLKPAP